MKRRYFKPCSLIILLCTAQALGQTQDSLIQRIISNVNLDTLVHHVRILSGEDSVQLGAQKYLITQRNVYYTATHQVAGNYIKQTLESYGLSVFEQYFTRFGLNGRNIYAVQTGTSDPDIEYIICAHYDAVNPFAADDNASGCAAVLESARLLSQRTTAYAVIYALWDMEENGSNGSYYYAARCDSFHCDIRGVINLEMFGWDSNDDGRIDIHTRNYANSVQLASLVANLDSVYSIGLLPVIYDPGTTASDHNSFWHFNYSAICVSEAYYGGDFNPNIHTRYDRVSLFNYAYFHRLSKLATASIAYHARMTITDVKDSSETPRLFVLLQNYPNPFNPTTTIKYALTPSLSQWERVSEGRVRVSLKVYDLLGRGVATLVNEVKQPGTYTVQWDASDVASGVYFYRMEAGNSAATRKLMVMK